MTGQSSLVSERTTARTRLGPAWVAAGLGVFGLSNFVFLALVGRDLGPAASAPVAVAWTVLNALGIGLFQPLEQETGRRIAAARGTSRPANVVRAVRYGLVASALVVGLGFALVPWLGDLLFSSARDIAAVVVLGLVGQALAYYARGVLAGEGRFVRYGAQLAVDGGLRIVLAGALFLVPDSTRLAYGLVLVVSPVVATLVTAAPRELVRIAGANHDAPRGPGLGALVAASTSAQLLANLGPVAMAALATPSQQALSGRFVAAVTVARVPLFLFAAIQAVFLPALARQIARNDRSGYRAALRRALLAALALAVVGVAGIWLLGTWALQLIYGAQFAVPVLTLVIIAVSGGVFMVAQVFAQTLLAHDKERFVAVAWSAGVVGAVVSLLLPGDLDVRVAVALTIGAVISLVCLVVVQRRTDRSWAQSISNPVEKSP